MQIFDRIDPSKLDRRDMQLWMMALGMLVIFAAGLALLVYPAAFEMPVVVSGPFLRQVFFGFCALSLLVVGYLMERRIVIQQLRRRLNEERSRSRQLLNQASADLLSTLPGFEHFQDRLAMEFRRAVHAQLPLSLVIASLKSSQHLHDPGDTSMAYGDAAKAMIRKLRGEDSIYLFQPGVFGVVLPGVATSDGHRVAERLLEGLADASGASTRFSFALRVVNYPEHVAAAQEMERAVTAFLSEERRAMAA
jgi:GGDEF domain-containing protein